MLCYVYELKRNFKPFLSTFLYSGELCPSSSSSWTMLQERTATTTTPFGRARDSLHSLRMFWFCFLGLYLLSTLACCNRPKIGHGPEGDGGGECGCLCLWCTKETCLSCRVMFWACKSFQETGFMSFSISFLLYFGPLSSEIVLVGLNGGGPGL